MKTFNKQLLTTGVLLLALCGLTSFNPLSHYYSDAGSANFASGSVQGSANDMKGIAAAAQQNADDAKKQASDTCRQKSVSQKKQFSPAQMSSCITAELTRIANEKKDEPAPKEAASLGSKCPDKLSKRYDPGANSLRKNDLCTDTQLMHFKTKGGLVVVERVEDKNSKNSADLGSADDEAKVLVTYRLVTDKDQLTEAGMCGGEICLREMSKPQTIALKTVSLKDIKEGLDEKSDALSKLRSELEDDMNGRRDHLEQHVANVEKEGCHKSDFTHDLSCFRDHFKKAKKGTEAYDDLLTSFTEFAKKAAVDSSISAVRLSQGLVSIAKLTNDKAFEKQVTAMVQEGLQYKNITAQSERQAKQLDAYKMQIDVLDRRLDESGCGIGSGGMNMQMPQFSGNNMYQQQFQPQMNYACSQLEMQRTQAVFQMENQVQSVKNQYHSNFFVGKKDDLSMELKQQLSSDYSSLVGDYEPYISDPSLMDLDATGTSSGLARTQQQQWTRIATPKSIVPVNGQQTYNPNQPTSIFTNNSQFQQIPFASTNVNNPFNRGF